MENNSNKRPNPDKEMVLKEADEVQSKLEELERSAKALNTCDIIDDEEIDDVEHIEKYDANKNRRRKKVKTKKRYLGHHRYYLHSGIKVRHVFLFVCVIIMAVLVIGRLMPPTGTPTAGNSTVVETKTDFGMNIKVNILEATFVNDELLVKIKVENQEKVRIDYNPKSFNVMIKDSIYVGSIEESENDLYANGLQPNESVQYTLKYKMPGEQEKKGMMSSMFKSETESCTIKTAIEWGK